jgi:dihydropteroate synthase
MAEVASRARAGLVLMHMKGTPQNMQHAPAYEDVIAEIERFLGESIGRAEAAGVSPHAILVDPGIGFGKTAEHNLQILNRLNRFARLSKPILVGASRKSFIGKILDLPTEDRAYGTAATVTMSIVRGAHVVRVHDVPEMVQVARMTDAFMNESTPSYSPQRGKVE